ncbi:MAG TPA: hypothetical protein VFE62_08780 [Gemmataceae bacterium]|nr:hypothetical protein [Gemmataceae bacterium]
MEPAQVALSESGAELLRKLADKTGQSPTEVLDAALDAYWRQIQFDEAGADAHLRNDPEAWAEFQADQKEWDDPPDEKTQGDQAPPSP